VDLRIGAGSLWLPLVKKGKSLGAQPVNPSGEGVDRCSCSDSNPDLGHFLINESFGIQLACGNFLDHRIASLYENVAMRYYRSVNPILEMLAWE
jgi:hypothetical protein